MFAIGRVGVEPLPHIIYGYKFNIAKHEKL